MASNRSKSDGELVAWGGRANRAYANLKDYAPVFIASCLLAFYAEVDGKFLAICIWTYLIARKLHFGSYLLGKVTARAAFWSISIIANLAIIFRLFSEIRF